MIYNLNWVSILAGNSFILAFNMFYDFIMQDEKDYRSYILWNAILHVIIFIGNLYIFLQFDKSLFDLCMGFLFGWIFAKFYHDWVEKEKFVFVKITNMIFIIGTILSGFIFL